MGKTEVKKTRDPEWYANLKGEKSVQFINYDLSAEDKVAFRKWAESNQEDLLTLVENLANAGYGLSVKWDVKAECYASFATCNKEGDPNKGWVLSGRGSTVFSAIMGVLYRHLVLFEAVWPVDTARRFSVDDM